MSAEPNETPYSDSHLESPEYRKRLLRKLNTLIAVLEVACAKVRRTLAAPEADTERLTRIHKNLNDTLQVCLRARVALERCERLPEDLPANLAQVVGQASTEAQLGETRPSLAPRLSGAAVEMSSASENEKFKKLGPVSTKDIRSCDLDELCRMLLG